ncbi:MAG: FkbM family methyltransferase [Chthoniobacterales bacterium]
MPSAIATTKRLVKRVIRGVQPVDTTESYSQCGEDRVIAYLFQQLHIHSPAYLDLGANHPVTLSNTYLFYRHNGRGVCVEADPTLFKAFKRKRPRDTCLNVAVAPQAGPPLTLHVFESSASGLNTVSEEWARHGQHVGGHRVASTVSVPRLGINELLAEHFASAPDLLSIDIEGLDLAVLQAIDLRSCRPAIICAETFLPMSAETGFKDVRIHDHLLLQGYRQFADTWINTIYVTAERFPSL